MVTLNLHVRHDSGIELRDKLLWDASRSSPTPEAFARQLCTDLGVPELSGVVAFSMREQLAKETAKETRDGGAATEGDGSMEVEAAAASATAVRTEREALDWSPQVTLPSGTSAEEQEALRQQEREAASERDRLRGRATASAR